MLVTVEVTLHTVLATTCVLMFWEPIFGVLNDAVDASAAALTTPIEQQEDDSSSPPHLL